MEGLIFGILRYITIKLKSFAVKVDTSAYALIYLNISLNTSKSFIVCFINEIVPVCCGRCTQLYLELFFSVARRTLPPAPLPIVLMTSNLSIP